MSIRPKVLLVGGPDVESRIPLMRRLVDFQIAAVGSTSELKRELTQAGFEYFPYPLHRGTNPFADFFTLLYLTRLFHCLRPDIVHTFDTKPGVWGRLAAKLAGVPVIIGTLPGLGLLYTDHSLSTRLIRGIYKPLQKLACTMADLTIFQHQEDSQYFISSGIVPHDKAWVISGSGVDTELYSPQRVNSSDRARVRGEFEISPEAMVISMVSRLIRAKGALEFGAAAEIVRQQHLNVKFILVGAVDTNIVDKSFSKELLDMQESVIFAGKRSDIPAVLAASDIFVLPSYYREGIPRVLLEAASMGLPMVTTDSPGCNEVVVDGLNGFLVPRRDAQALTDAILRLASNLQMRQRFGQASRNRAVIKFDLSIIAHQTADVYRKLLAEKGLQ